MSETKSLDKKLLNKKVKQSPGRGFSGNLERRWRFRTKIGNNENNIDHQVADDRSQVLATSREVSIDNIERVEGVFQRERGEGEARDYGGRSK